MASLGAGYDLSATTFSPDGRIFQVEYAAKAVEAAGTVVGLRVRNGVVLVVEKPVASRLLKMDASCSANRRIMTVDDAAGVAGAGVAADIRALANRAREEAASSRQSLEKPMRGAQLAERMALFMQAYTLYSSVRPFCASLLVAAVDDTAAGGVEGECGLVPGEEAGVPAVAMSGAPAGDDAAGRVPCLYMIEPSGQCLGYRGCAAGKGRQAARTEIEKLDLDAMDVRAALEHAVRIVHFAHDESKDRDFVVEASWIGAPSAWRHQAVPADVLAAAVAAAKAAVSARMDLG